MSDEEHYRMGWPATDYTPIDKYHTHPYAAISPTLPALSAVGKNILVTGGGFGIGLSIVNAFATAGASRITIIGRNRSTLEGAKLEVETRVPTTEIAVFPASLTDQNAVKEMFATERAAHREYDIVVLCAGFMHGGASLFDVTDEEYDNSFNLNVHGNIHLVRQYLKVPSTVVKPKTIVDISSIIVQDRSPIFSLYHLTKSTFTNFMHQLHLEQSDTGLKTFSVHPGLIFTGMATRVGLKETDLPFDHRMSF